jgi:conjugative transfer region protein TrbK
MMDVKMLVRLGAIVFVAMAVTATAIGMTRKQEAPIYQTFAPGSAESVDPLHAELIRCAGIGEAGPRDPACLHTWIENRRRFLAPGVGPAERQPDAPQSPRPTTTGSASAIPLQSEEAR